VLFRSIAPGLMVEVMPPDHVGYASHSSAASQYLKPISLATTARYLMWDIRKDDHRVRPWVALGLNREEYDAIRNEPRR
jgi:hypothetical protein